MAHEDVMVQGDEKAHRDMKAQICGGSKSCDGSWGM